MVTQEPSGGYVFSFIAGPVCLDFANTLSGRRDRPTERLNTYADLVSWGRQAGLLTDRDARLLVRAAAQHPRDAGRVLTEAIALRETLYRLFAAGVDGTPAPGGDVAALNAALSHVLSRLRLVPQSGEFQWAWPPDTLAFDRMLWPVVRSAADLLASGDLHRVRRCAGESCDWLFLDATRNRSRRWCDMRDCGNRAKARRHYARKKATGLTD